MQEKCQPTSEDYKKAEEMMTGEQREATEVRKEFFGKALKLRSERQKIKNKEGIYDPKSSSFSSPEGEARFDRELGYLAEEHIETLENILLIEKEAISGTPVLFSKIESTSDGSYDSYYALVFLPDGTVQHASTFRGDPGIGGWGKDDPSENRPGKWNPPSKWISVLHKDEHYISCSPKTIGIKLFEKGQELVKIQGETGKYPQYCSSDDEVDEDIFYLREYQSDDKYQKLANCADFLRRVNAQKEYRPTEEGSK